MGCAGPAAPVLVPGPTQQVRPPWPAELATIAFLLVGYDRVADLARLRTDRADAAARALLRVEGWLHLDLERGLVAHVSPHASLGRLLAVYYDLAHGLVTIGVLVGVYALAPVGYRHARRALLVVNVVALVVFAVLPVTPPRLLPGAGVADVVARSGTWGAWTTGAGVARHADEYASLPSLHVAWAVWVLLAVWVTGRRLLRRAAVVHLALTVVVVLVTGNHYLLDVAAAALLTSGAWAATAGPVRPRTAGRRPGAPPPP